LEDKNLAEKWFTKWWHNPLIAVQSLKWYKVNMLWR